MDIRNLSKNSRIQFFKLINLKSHVESLLYNSPKNTPQYLFFDAYLRELSNDISAILSNNPDKYNEKLLISAQNAGIMEFVPVISRVENSLSSNVPSEIQFLLNSYIYNCIGNSSLNII